MYSFNGVEAGTYTMKVSKANHVTREYTVVVGNSPIPLDAKIHLLGDINGDGKCNTVDKKMIFNHIKDSTKALTGYEFDCADIDGNQRVNVADKKKVYNHLSGTSLWTTP
jgi:hypothetical protein